MVEKGGVAVFLRKICQAIARCCAPTYQPPKYPRRSFLPHVTVQFTDAFLQRTGIEYADDQEKRLGELWEELRKRNPRIRLRPLYRGATGEGRKRFEEFVRGVVRRNPKYEPPNFFAFYRIVGPPGTDFAGIAKRLQAETGDVLRAEVLKPAVAPQVLTANQPRYPNQLHLQPAPPAVAPGGINAPAAWPRPGGNGAGIRFVDVERGWLLDHEDLPPNLNSPGPGPLLLHGANDAWSDYHGTAVLGILCAMDDTFVNAVGGGNAVGGVGIAPRAEGYVSSWFEGYDELEGFELANHAEAIRVATVHLTTLRLGPIPSPPGDVLLLEAQLEDPANAAMRWPLDADPGIAAQVGLATAAGITVVEAGGNGDGAGNYLDTGAEPPALGDSGAILVSAAHIVAGEIVPMSYAPRGPRVNCFAWGFGLNTCWADGGGTNTLYTPAPSTPAFDGSSAAAAVVAGAAIVLQGMARHHRSTPVPGEIPLVTAETPLTPNQMRLALSHERWNTPPANASGTGLPHPIGRMPDLARLIVALGADDLHRLPA